LIAFGSKDGGDYPEKIIKELSRKTPPNQQQSGVFLF
jgi:hypothetical protein